MQTTIVRRFATFLGVCTLLLGPEPAIYVNRGCPRPCGTGSLLYTGIPRVSIRNKQNASVLKYIVLCLKIYLDLLDFVKMFVGFCWDFPGMLVGIVG